MAAAAETLQTETFEEIIGHEIWRPLVINVAELESDRQVQTEARRFIGAVALGDAIISDEVRQAAPWTLMDAIRGAAAGSDEGMKMTTANVRTDVIERTLKAGHIVEVPMEINADGEIMQYGQTAADIQANSLRFACDDARMRARTEAETRNMFRMNEALRQGLLDEYNFVVFSRAADDMSETDAQKAGFFTDTMSCAIQVTSCENGAMQVESAFVAGKKTWDGPRHDAVTIAKLGAELGTDLSYESATDLVDTPLLIHKSLMPNGVVDVVKLYDDCAGGAFFGQDKPRQNYLAYLQKCREREASFGPRIQAITKQLIDRADSIKTPQDACAWLNKLSQKEMLEHSITDDSIDARVFGIDAAYRIEHARFYYAQGDLQRVQQLTRQAKSLARSSSCPGGVSGGTSTGPENTGEGESDGTSSSNELKDCEFISKECPKCHKKNVKTVVKKGRYYGACGCKS
ncbi:MAG TPA: hypothetical protein VFL85_01810 [Candidatus Saccharimonadales bacterium]|nr:hypothetical protein [Candidatus Saccharimonadales bacterium]